ncbi:MAG: RNase adapter RapZ [Nitriliruptoraceae bacterium]
MSAPDPGKQRILIISGLSGAGRSTVSNVVEDLGWFVIDNLPPELIGRVADLAFSPGSSIGKLAVVADVRGREFFDDLVGSVSELQRPDTDLRVIFLEADGDALHRRFEETRRRHPAADGGTVLDGIERERDQLRELRGLADVIIDTTALNVHELRDRIVELLGDASIAPMRIELVSFGFKHGSPREADVQFDVRFLPNPHWVAELRPMTGRDQAVHDYVFGQPRTNDFVDAVKKLLDITVPGYVLEGKRYLTIAIGCTGGKHRSVAISEVLGDYVRQTTGLPVSVRHRDLGAE